jgi:hypothetical protein
MYSQLDNTSGYNDDDDGINRSDDVHNNCMQSSKAVTMTPIIVMAMVE